MFNGCEDDMPKSSHTGLSCQYLRKRQEANNTLGLCSNPADGIVTDRDALRTLFT
jgi:hypothetical protein